MATSVDEQHRPPAVAEAILDDAVQALRERLDVLLDRLADTVLGAPTAGSTRWRAQFDTPEAVTRAVRAMIAARAGVVDPAAPRPLPPQRRNGATTGVSGRRRRARIDPAQLPIF
ncbi:hypothetical protein [Rhodococcus sp. NBC_00294]|uniref:hypothetical protein n=1 Tax=Rhodococcus sp. NBC_00294 TaxID=2976004 RepID=UPI002E2DFA30|nr:hypothetical protein [Rhodococcus sp. NBC_00294]